VDKSTRKSVSTSATRTTARGSNMIANIASMVLLIGLGFVIAIAIFVGVLMFSYEE
jgi:ABC-type transport system involved in Fe-S cluster assembly fused permease/ATPase subunit